MALVEVLTANPSVESWRLSRHASVLESVGTQGVNLVVWRRELPRGLDSALLHWASREPERLDVSLPQGVELPPVATALAEPHGSWLRQDIAQLLSRFQGLVGEGPVRVSFSVVRSDLCQKFHVDYIRRRLVTTYLGPATEWVADDAVQRSSLRHPAVCPLEANASILRKPDGVQRAAAGDVILMQGAMPDWERAAVHRSPALRGTGLTRVVLTLSTVEGS